MFHMARTEVECCVLLTGLSGKQGDLYHLGTTTSVRELQPRFSWKGFQYAQVTFSAGGAFRDDLSEQELLNAVRGIKTNMGFEESAFESLGDSQESWVLYGIAGITPDGGACERLSAEERREWRRLSAVERREVRAILEEELLSLDLQ